MIPISFYTTLPIAPLFYYILYFLPFHSLSSFIPSQILPFVLLRLIFLYSSLLQSGWHNTLRSRSLLNLTCIPSVASAHLHSSCTMRGYLYSRQSTPTSLPDMHLQLCDLGSLVRYPTDPFRPFSHMQSFSTPPISFRSPTLPCTHRDAGEIPDIMPANYFSLYLSWLVPHAYIQTIWHAFLYLPALCFPEAELSCYPSLVSSSLYCVRSGIILMYFGRQLSLSRTCEFRSPTPCSAPGCYNFKFISFCPVRLICLGSLVALRSPRLVRVGPRNTAKCSQNWTQLGPAGQVWLAAAFSARSPFRCHSLVCVEAMLNQINPFVYPQVYVHQDTLVFMSRRPSPQVQLPYGHPCLSVNGAKKSPCSFSFPSVLVFLFACTSPLSILSS